MISKPHTFTIRQESRDETISYGSAVSLSGQITPANQTRVMEEYGVETSRPHLLIAGLDAESYLNIGALVSYNARRFKIVTPASRFDIGNAASHASCVMEEITPETINA